jgi:hypothetical protein
MNSLLLEYRIRKLEKLLLNEAKQVGTLYHVCTLNAFLKYILPTDTLSASGKYNNYLYGGKNYVSFTRDKNFVVSTNTVNHARILIRLVVDGDLLSERYKIGPYNDFAYDTKSGNFDPSNDYHKSREMEEVVKGPIKNISKYIKEIQFDVCDLEEKTINDLKKLSRKRNIGSANIVYCHFAKGDSNYERLIKSSGVKNGMSIKDAAELLESATINDVEPLLFSGDIEKIKQAIESGADLNVKYSKGYPIIYYAAMEGTSDIIELLLNSGANMNVISGKPLLSIVAYSNGDVDNAKVLIKHGADADEEDNSGWTPLMHAADTGNAELVKYFISLGIDVNHTNKWGNCALDVASTDEINDILVKAGAR